MNIDQVLSHDSIAETEKLVGKKHYSEFNELEQGMMLLNFIEHNRQKENILKSANDTYFNMSWDYFINLIKEHGFVEGLTYDFKHYQEKDRTERAIIYYHPSKGLVIWATSYGNITSVNGGTMYGEIKFDETNTELWKVLSGCSHGHSGEGFRHFSKDIREGLIHTINKIDNKCEFSQKWNKRQFLWFCDYTDEKTPGYDHNSITKAKIKQCPKELQDILIL